MVISKVSSLMSLTNNCLFNCSNRNHFLDQNVMVYICINIVINLSNNLSGIMVT